MIRPKESANDEIENAKGEVRYIGVGPYVFEVFVKALLVGLDALIDDWISES